MLDFVLLQAAGDGQGGMMQFLLFLVIGVVFYFFMIRPQQKRQKDQKKFIEAVKKGDMIVTIGGVHGKIVEIDGDIITIDVDRGTKLKIEKSSVSYESSKQYLDEDSKK